MTDMANIVAYVCCCVYSHVALGTEIPGCAGYVTVFLGCALAALY